MLAGAVAAVLALDAINRELTVLPIFGIAMTGLVAAAVMNRRGIWRWAGWAAFLSVLLPTIDLVVQARDGFRSLAMFLFPGLLLISVMLLDRVSYIATAVTVLITVAALGIAEKHGLTRAVPGVRTPTSYESIFYVDLILLVMACIGSRIVREAQMNISDLRTIIKRLSSANLELTNSAKAQQDSELKYRRLYESITDAVVAVDLAGHILETNPAYEAMLGYTGEELRRMTYQELTPETWHDFEAGIVAEQILAKGRSEVYEKEYRRRSGTVFPVEVRRYLLRNEINQPVGMWAIVHEITGRKRAEAALRESEERHRLAIKATNDAIWDIDLKAGTVSWNDTYSVLYGRPETADSWQFWVDRIHPEDRARTVGSFQAALAGDASSWTAEYRFRRADGEWASIYDRAYIARDESGNAWRVIGAMQDLTVQKRAEAALRESEERFRRVFEEGPLGLGLVGKDYRFVQVNSALCQMVGYTEAELLQKTFAEITHPDDARADVELADRLFKREIPLYHIQKRYVKKNGEIIWIRLTASIILGADGEPVHGLGMVEDITEIKRAQEEALFSQKLESLGTLAGGIAHDFNNLLGAVQAQAELALAELDAGSSCREELEAIHGVAVRGSEIVRQLMIYAGKERDVVEQADLSKIVAEMLSLLRVSVTKHAALEADLEPELRATCASSAQIRQIVMNLVTNASDAIGDRDGVIRVITRRAHLKGESTPASSGILPDLDYVELEVSDTGRGMPSQTQAKVFDPFFTTKSAGRGLGLAIVQGIVRSLGGAIHLVSEPDRGTTFQVLLPCAETTAEASGQLNSGDGELAVQSHHATVLVVEDENYLRQAIGKMLRKNGFEVFESADGTSAIDLLRADGGKIDVILLDMTIPGATSHEVVAEAANVKPDIRVILTSAYSQELIAGPMSPPQINSFIRKPFQLGDLMQTLRSSLSS
jgi:PAS domain S-box-containing protein